jgi:MFS family permease
VRAPGGFVAGFRYVLARPDLRAILLMLFLIGTFGMNFQLYISAMAVKVFHTDAGGYGLLASMMAVGTVTGALLAAGRDRPRIELLLSGCAVFAIGCTLAAIVPSYWMFGATLVIIGISALTITNSTNSLMQLSTEPAMRGRVMAIRLAIAMGGTPIGAPFVGWVADRFGPRWSFGVGATAGYLAAVVMVFYLVKYRDMRVSFAGGRLRFTLNDASPSAAGTS